MNSEIKKVDSEGKVELPKEWRETELKESNEVIILMEEGVLKIFPKKKIDLTKYFDSLEFDEDLIDKLEDWNEFEKAYLNKKQVS